MKKLATIATSAALLGLVVATPASAHNEKRDQKIGLKSSFSISKSTSTATSTKVKVAPIKVKAQHISLLGKVTAVSGNTLTLEGRDKTWTVNLTSSTTLYGLGVKKIDLNQIQVGDKVLAKGSVVNGTSTTINANVIQNLSLHVLKMSFRGVVSNLNEAARSFTLTLANNKALNVTLTPDVVLKADVKSTSTATSSFANIQNGSVVTVFGLMDRNSTTTLSGTSVKIHSTTTLKSWDNDDQKKEIKKVIEQNRASIKSFLQSLFR